MTRSLKWSTRAVCAVAIFVIAQGLLFRWWLIRNMAIDSDEGIVGLMAMAIHRGEFMATFWGQNYGGVEPYFISAVLGILPESIVALRIAPALLGIVGLYFIWRIALRVLEHRALALAVVAITTAHPIATLFVFSKAWGFRTVTYAASFIALWLVTRIIDGATSLTVYAALGLTLGVGLWSNVEIAYVGTPCVVFVVHHLITERDRRFVLTRLSTLGASAVMGAMPWLWRTVTTGFDTFHSVPPEHSVFGRARIFFTYTYPTQLGLRQYWSGIDNFRGSSHWISIAIQLVFAALLIASLVVAFRRGGLHRLIAIICVVTPLMIIINPASEYWNDGRYAIFTIPLYLLVLGTGLNALAVKVTDKKSINWSHALRLGTTAVVLVVASYLSTQQLNDFAIGSSIHKTNLLTQSSSDSRGYQTTADALVDRGITTAWADYWVAYQLDYLSDGKLRISPLGPDFARYRPYAAATRSNQMSPFIVTRPWNVTDPMPADQFETAGLMTFGELTSELDRLGVSYTVEPVGAVYLVTPSTPVDVREIKR